MRYCRFMLHGHPVYGSIEDREGQPWITATLPAPEEDLAARLQPADSDPSVTGPMAASFDPVPLSEATLLPPVAPSKIICVGPNLPLSREEPRQRGPGGAAALLQAAVVASCSRRHCPHARSFAARGL